MKIKQNPQSQYKQVKFNVYFEDVNLLYIGTVMIRNNSKKDACCSLRLAPGL